MNETVKNNSPNVLHGNMARIDGRKNIVPRFTNYVANDYISRNHATYNRLGDDSEFCKKEVDNNQK